MKPSFDFREIEFLNGYTSFKARVSTVYDLLNSIMTICIYIKNEISNYFSILFGRKQKLRKCLEQECTVQVKSQICRLMVPCNKWDWCKLRWFCFFFLAVNWCKPLKHLIDKRTSIFYISREIPNVLLRVLGFVANNRSRSLYIVTIFDPALPWNFCKFTWNEYCQKKSLIMILFQYLMVQTFIQLQITESDGSNTYFNVERCLLRISIDSKEDTQTSKLALMFFTGNIVYQTLHAYMDRTFQCI